MVLSSAGVSRFVLFSFRSEEGRCNEAPITQKQQHKTWKAHGSNARGPHMGVQLILFSPRVATTITTTPLLPTTLFSFDDFKKKL